jgi:hypothetical protein
MTEPDRLVVAMLCGALAGIALALVLIAIRRLA